MRDLYDKIAREDEGLAEARTPITSLPSSVTAQFSITAPGVYYLTGNVTGVAGLACIEVLADEVEIECDGFTFFGVPNTGACIVTPSPQRAIGVYDAGFSEWPNTCIEFSLSSHCYVEECWFSLCSGGASGVCLLGGGGTVDDCNVLSCANGRVAVGSNGIIEECLSVDSGGGCFYSPGPAVMEDNFAINNLGTGITIDQGGVVIGNRLVNVRGVVIGTGSVVAENDFASCPGTAITVTGSRCNVEENHVAGGAAGVLVLSPAESVMVDGNNICVSSTAVTISAGTSRCTVVRNAVSVPGGVPAFSIDAASSYGTIVDATGGGEIGAATGGVVSPLANLLY